jgi:hypothetical protein
MEKAARWRVIDVQKKGIKRFCKPAVFACRANRWLNTQSFRPRKRWQIARSHINFSERSVLIADDTVLAKPRSKKINRVNYQYSGNAQDVISSMSLINLLWHGLDNEESIPVDYRIDDTS